MAKSNAKDFLLQKGEKIVLGLALVGFGGLTVMGLTSMLGAESPAKKTAEFKTSTDRIKSEIGRNTGDPLITRVQTPDLSLRAVEPAHFRSPVAPFETVDRPSDKRDNPAVLGIIDAQVDLVRAPIKAFDVVQYDDGKIEIGVLKNVKVGQLNQQDLSTLLDKYKKSRTGGGGGGGGGFYGGPPPVAPPAPIPPPQPGVPPLPFGGGAGSGPPGRGERGGGAP
jgi:hypothetical protein